LVLACETKLLSLTCYFSTQIPQLIPPSTRSRRHGFGRTASNERVSGGAVPGLQEQDIAAAKFDVEIEVEWATLAAPGQSHNYASSIGPVYFDPLVQALESITADELGAEALQESLKKIVIKCDQKRNDLYWAEFSDGILELDKELSNVSDVASRAKSLTGVLERAL
jgi:hypothetical protein